MGNMTAVTSLLDFGCGIDVSTLEGKLIQEQLKNLALYPRADIKKATADVAKLAAELAFARDEIAVVKAQREATENRYAELLKTFRIAAGWHEKASTYVTALRRIEKWFGEFPETGKFWDDAEERPMSYGACYGSNGERDYMRGIAREALK
jgi:hypothetical protein